MKIFKLAVIIILMLGISNWSEVVKLGAAIAPLISWDLVGRLITAGVKDPAQLNRTLGIWGVSVGLGVLLIKCMMMGVRRKNKLDAYGSARWASIMDVRRMGFNRQEGVILGKLPWTGMLAHNGVEHILLTAPTRSGKGVGFIIPTLYAWLGSVVVLDLKKENWAATAGFRQQFSHVICFDPTKLDSAGWDPLLEVRKGVHEVKDAQNIADILIDPNGSYKTRNHWQQAGHTLLVAAILQVLYLEPTKTLAGVANFLANPMLDIRATLQYMRTSLHINKQPHPVIASIAQEMLNKSAEELSGVVSTAISCLGLYRDQLVANATSKSDFTINDLMNAENPVSLYLVVPAGDLDRLITLSRLLINLLCRRLTEGAIVENQPPHKHKLLLLLDEFPALGCMEFFKKALGFMAGYNIKCMLVCQSYNNIYEHYGLKNSIIDNCHIRVTLAPNDYETAKMISASLGQMTLARQQINLAGKRAAPFLTNISVSDNEIGRNLLNPDEIQQLTSKQVIVQVANHPPILAKKLVYYAEQIFMQRWVKAPELTEVLLTQSAWKKANQDRSTRQKPAVKTSMQAGVLGVEV